MRSIHSDVMRRGGVAATFELLKDGHTSHQLTRAVRRGEVIRARQGHYVSPSLSEDEIRAIRVGGRLTGLSGARMLGIWTPATSRLHVRAGSNARGLRSPDDATRRLRMFEAGVRWRSQRTTGTRTTMSAVDCLDDIVRTESTRVAFACLESALHNGIIRQREAHSLIKKAPRSVRRRLRSAGRASESGTESLLSFDLTSAGIRFRQQEKIAGVGRVDFVIGTRLVIEVDGAEFHTGREAFERDRARDARLSALGYRVLRFSHRQLISDPALVLRAIVAAIARGDAE